MIYRITGENVIERMGYNITGDNAFDVLSTSIREASKQMYQCILQHPCGNYIVYENGYKSGRRMISESLLLPIRKNPDGDPTFVLAYHAHHQGTDIYHPVSEITLGVAILTNEFVDIGSGLPTCDLGTFVSADSYQAESV